MIFYEFSSKEITLKYQKSIKNKQKKGYKKLKKNFKSFDNCAKYGIMNCQYVKISLQY